MKFGDHLWQNFDKLLVTLVLLLVMGMTLYLIIHHADDPQLQWIEQLAGNMASALVTLLGAGKLAAMIKPATNGNANGTVTPPPATTPPATPPPVSSTVQPPVNG